MAEGPIGEARGERLRRHIVTTLGTPEGFPLRFANSYCRFGVASLGELTEAQGKELLATAERQVKVWRAEQVREKEQAAAKAARYRREIDLAASFAED